jgi:trimeric autotransporter adhesin
MKPILMNHLYFVKQYCAKSILAISFTILFSFCAFAQPANDNCNNSISRNSSTTCNNTAYTLNNATASAGIPGVPCVAGTHYDVWFRFTATTTSHTVTISSLGTNFTNPEVAIFSGTCGALAQIACGTTSVNPTGLTIGTVYYIRVSKVGGAAIATNGGFNICVTHLGTPPTNNECATATSLTSNTSCNNTASTLVWATASAGIPGVPCVVGTHYDVWYSFTAVSNTHTATISNRSTGFTNPEVAIFSGPCGTLAQLACGTTSASSSALTIGATYYVRVSHIGSMVTSNGGFDICVTHPTAPANDNCAGATTLTSTATPTCTNVAGTLYNANNSGLAGTCTAANPTFDVWYRFTATSTTHAVTVSSLGSSLTAATTYMQLFSGTCGTPVNIACQTVSTTGGRITSATLTVGAVYYIRVYRTAAASGGTSANWSFSICLQNPPVNDLCANATVLTPGVTCVNTAGTLDLAIPTVLGVASGCSVPGTYYDVFYRFTAAAVSQTIAISGAGSGITAPRITIYTLCGGAPLVLGCTSGTSHTQAGLAIGTQYWVGISNFNANPSGTGGAANFNICITNVPVPPGNDNCSGAILLTSGTTCSNTAGTMINATATAGLPACGSGTSPDVWYRFVAQSAFPVITLSSVGLNLGAQNPRIQLFSGACGTLTQLTGACVASPLNTINTPGGSGLTIGQTYYVRITTVNMFAPVATGTYTFNICITDPVPHPITTIDYAKSYVNITSGTVGGTINPGDVLEIRSTLVIRGATTIDSIGYFDTLRAGGGLALVPNTIRTRTNEGKVFQTFTDLSTDADAGLYRTAGAGTDTTIQIHLGPTATRTAKGALSNTSLPSLFGSTCVTMATYRVTVNAAYGTKIEFGGGAFTYRIPGSASGIKIAFPNDSLMVYQSVGICPDNVSNTNILGDEFNGTFGTPAVSAGSQNRGTSPNTSYQYQAFNPSGPGDYFYGVANNTSANFTTVQTLAKPAAAGPRVFNVWDITGDHTGAVDMGNVSRGNRPCNPLQPISATNPCGYMLVVNAAYRTDVAFDFNVSGACPNTYYEISAWVKNICYKCGDDVNGVNSSSGNPAYIPTVPGPAGSGDSSGVRPNLAFEIDGVDYYTTGDIPYAGIPGTQTGSDTLNRWVRKSFIYRTGPTQTGFELTIRNNAPGGGGNDWALDDITLRTCYPNMSYAPSIAPTICANSTITIRDTVRSYYNSYVEYKWQRSTNGGVAWTDIPGTTATASPTLIGGMYQFIAVYTVPPAWTTMANNGNQYRLVVATTVANLAGSCNFSDVIPITVDIDYCLDIDDDNDGIPDYVEFNNPVALQDANSNGIPNWKDPTYPGYIDNDVDGVNDNFDWAGDVNNNGVPNFRDPSFAPWVDSNGDGVNDNSDKDLDGLPNQLDRDSDNDGIFDVVESYGVDTNGDGIIDNYTDTDADGFSQNVDANNTGVQGSGNGLGAQDLDADGIANYLDTDSDNDGIPDLVEAAGADINNNGRIDIGTDIDYDGIGDSYINGSALLLTGADVGPVDGRADDFPYKNLDRDLRPNAYDLDSDGDGIVDVIEAGLPDANLNGLADGVIGTNGWSGTISALPAINLRNTDATGNPDYLDIDSDNDGIPDNIEGMSTAGYIRPTAATDTDGDGLINHYDNLPAAFSGSGIFVYDHDGDGTPDYRDSDTDADGQPDVVEGNDFNLNGLADDLVTLTGLDTDGDGLDNRFDSLNSVTNIKGTSYRMGTGGTFTGDPAPGSKTTVQRQFVSQADRDWRFVGNVLPAQFLNFTGVLQNSMVPLNWTIITTKEIDHFEVERSTDNATYIKVGTVSDAVRLNEQQSFGFTDNVSNVSSEIIYYRLKIIGKSGEIQYSNILFVRKATKTMLSFMPNPANNYVTLNIVVDRNIKANISIVDKVGKKVLTQNENLVKGTNNLTLDIAKYSEGVYAIIVETTDAKIIKQLIIVR